MRSRSEWEIMFNGLSGTSDKEINVVHISRVIIEYTFELLSFLTEITHDLQHTINFKKKYIEKETQKVRAPIKLTHHWRQRLYISLRSILIT